MVDVGDLGEVAPLEVIEERLRATTTDARERGGQRLETEFGVNVRAFLRVGEVGPVIFGGGGGRQSHCCFCPCWGG